MGIFTNGLKEDIQAELGLTKPKNLGELIEQAYRVEERNWVFERIRPKLNKSPMSRVASYSRVTPSPKPSRPNWWSNPNRNLKPPFPNRLNERREKLSETPVSPFRSNNF